MTGAKLLLLITFLCVFSLNTQGQDVISICYEEQTFKPFIFGKGEHRGLLVDLTREAALAVNLQVEYTRLPWKRCVAQFYNGSIDAVFGMIWSEARDSKATFPKALDGSLDSQRHIWTSIYSVFVKKDTDLVWNGLEFKNLRYGVSAPSGYIAYDKLIELEAIPDMNIVAAQGFRLVSQGRLDGYVFEQLAGEQLAKKLNLSDEITVLPIPFLSTNWYVPVSNEFYQHHADKAEQFWTEIKTLRETKSQELLNKYLSSP